MIPFDLSRMDGGTNGRGFKTVDRVYDIGRLYIGVSDKCSDCAAFLLGRLEQSVRPRRGEAAC